MPRKKNVKLEKLTDNISYRIIYDTIYLFQGDDNILEEEIMIASKKLTLIIEDNNISYINISGKGIEDRHEFYQKLGFTLSYYDVHKLSMLYPDKKNKMDYRCYGIMTKNDFLNVSKKENVQEEKIYGDNLSSNKGYVSNLLLLFGGIVLLCFFCIQGAIYLVR